MTGEKRLREITDSVQDIGIDATAEKLKIEREYIRRVLRFSKNKYQKKDCSAFSKNEKEEFEIFKSRFSPEERKLILSGSAFKQEQRTSIVNFDSDEVMIAFITDTHMGAKHFLERYWYSMLEECTKRGVKMILHAGDITEGMSSRPNQIYELVPNLIGASAQIEYARKLLSEIDVPFKFVDGNHDRWSIASNGLFIGKEIARGMDNVEFLGNDYGHVNINGTDWMLSHGNDSGSAYARSYRAQKKVEAFKSGMKPNVLLLGHDHKQNYGCYRNIHTVQGGALCTQSEFMRSTGKENCDGFHIIRAGIADGEIKWFEPRWYQFY